VPYRIIVVMKRILPLFCLALAALPLAGQAADLGVGGALSGFGGVKLAVSLGGDPGDRFGRRHGGGDDNGGGGGGRDRGGEDRSSDNINIARSLASRYGRVLDASQISETVYSVRVMTPDGRRLDLIVDVRSGRVSGA
jgi:hypothetical protein